FSAREAPPAPADPAHDQAHPSLLAERHRCREGASADARRHEVRAPRDPPARRNPVREGAPSPEARAKGERVNACSPPEQPAGPLGYHAPDRRALPCLPAQSTPDGAQSASRLRAPRGSRLAHVPTVRAEPPDTYPAPQAHFPDRSAPFAA